MNGCHTCGGYGMHHDPVAHDAEPTWEVCTRCLGEGGHAWDGPCTDCLGEGQLPASDARLTADSADDAPPLFADRCKRHGDVAEPGPCGDCKDVRTAAKARPPLTLVGQMQRCLVHDESYVSVCRGCAADRLAGEAS